MVHYQSPKWQIFVSRPNSILKRDFMKWCYFMVGNIKGFKLTKILAIGNYQEMDVFIDKKEDQANEEQIVKNYYNKKIEEIFNNYKKLISNYHPHGANLAEQSLNAFKEIGSFLLYSYYVERLAEIEKSKRNDKLIELNGYLRELGARIIYPLYDRAHAWLRNQHKSKLIDYYTIAELPIILNHYQIEARKDFYIFFGTKKGTRIYTGKAAQDFLHQYNFKPIKVRQAKELKGLPICSGKVTGEVKIVRGLADVKNSLGKIVVSRETIIEYTPYLKQVRALVTDIGGVNCHAAIVAREFKIPCVVGTKFATQVFQNGDAVEVDANRGIVKILKENKAA